MQANDNREWLHTFKDSPAYRLLEQKPIAYFSSEYALSPSLPIYAGGLGVLAGDMVREVAENTFPVFFVGLRYKRGQHMITSNTNSVTDELTLVTNVHSERILLSIPLYNRRVHFQVWRWSDNGAQVYLLDTDITENIPEDRSITKQLYAEERPVRLAQEILLGIGGFRLLRKLGFHPSVFHLNEGHSAFLALELVHHEMQHQHVDFPTACSYARKHILFTNHTLVAAGQELFAPELIEEALDAYAKEIDVAVGDIVALGLDATSDLFSMTTFSFRFSSRTNGVSRLHTEKARVVWPDYPMENVTNGIYLPRWDRIDTSIPLWRSHQQNKRELLTYIREHTGEVWDEDILLFGWGRRFVPYKQPLLFLQELERLIALATDSKRPFRIVFSGPTNEEGVGILEHQLRTLIEEKLKGIAVFLPHYNVELATLMTAGCDVWLNTPVVGSEACGTSGMKAALNGALPLSTRDGWVAEIPIEGLGWIADGEAVSNTLLDITAHDITPLYYLHLTNPEYSVWSTYMKNCRALIETRFSTTRALREYIEKFYIPILRQKHEHRYE